jgi:hypothetical protein
MKIRLKYPEGLDFTRAMVPAIIKNVEDALNVIAADAASLFSDATPVGIYGAAQGGWEKNVTTTVNPVRAVATVENVQPYVYYVVHGVLPGSPWNPGRHIVAWVEKKLPVSTQYRIVRASGVSEATARGMAERGKLAVSVAYMIGRKRQMHGSKGNDFVAAVVAQNEARWERIVVHAIDRALNHS